MKLNEAIEGFKLWRGIRGGKRTIMGYDLALRQFCIFVRNCSIEEIKLSDVVEWFTLMEQLKWKRNSFCPKASALKAFLEFYQKQGYRVIDPWLVPMPSYQYDMPRVATEEEYQKLLNVIPEHTKDARHTRNRAIINLLWDTGARIGEILSLNVKDVDLEGMRATIKTEKSRAMLPIREIFWTRPTSETLRQWLKRREKIKAQEGHENALFISVCSGGNARRNGKRFNNNGAGEMLRRYSYKAGIMPSLNAHSFRHHMGHYIVKQGGSAADVMNILGHSNIATATIYTRMTDAELETRYRRLKGSG